VPNTSDISFYSTSRPWLDASLPIIASGLGDWSLNVNQEKTEWIHISATATEWRNSKQLGSLLGDEEDIRRRMEQASRSYGRMYSLWLRKHIVPESTRLRLYNAIVLPTLLYNCETWGATASVMERLDAFHWKQLRALLGVKYSDRVSNDTIYARAKSVPLSEIVAQRRLRMTGHVLRMETSTPPQLAMSAFFVKDAKGLRGRPRSTLAMSVKSSLSQRDISLATTQDLAACRQQALDKQAWRNMVK